MKNKANPPTEEGTDKGQHNNEPASLRELVERRLENAGAGNVVDLVRNVVGPEPLRDQPRSIRLFAVVFLAVPLVMILVIEWNFRQMIPTWISFPLTAIAFISYLWRYSRRTKSAGHASQTIRAQTVGAVSPPLSDNSPDASEARMFARLLVSEIKLYNPDLVARGVREGSIYHLLKKEIDRARSMYDSRIPLATRNLHDYFQEELVRILANGNADLVS